MQLVQKNSNSKAFFQQYYFISYTYFIFLGQFKLERWTNKKGTEGVNKQLAKKVELATIKSVVQTQAIKR